MTTDRAPRRATLAALACGAGLLGARRAAGQQQQPTLDRLARTMIGFPPGGSSDTVARLYAERLRAPTRRKWSSRTARAPAGAWPSKR